MLVQKYIYLNLARGSAPKHLRLGCTVKFQIRLKSLMRQGLSEIEFYGDLVYKLKKIVGSNNISAQFIKIISQF